MRAGPLNRLASMRLRRFALATLATVVLFGAGVAAAGVDLKRVLLKPGQCVTVAKVSVCAAKAKPPVTVTSTVTAPPSTLTRTITTPPVTITNTATITNTVTGPTVTVTSTRTVTVTTTVGVQDAFGNGTFRVNIDISPGTYRNSDSSNGCYWKRVSGFGGTFDEIIANQFTHDITIVTIAPSDVGFVSEDCGRWSKLT